MMARNLPQEWQAVPAANVQTIDLTKLASATIPQDIICQGDVLAVDIAVGRKKEDDVSAKPRVQTNGEIELSNIGNVSVLGLSMLEAEDAIRTTAINQDIYKDPQVTVSMYRAKTNRITVIGAVDKQGVIELRPGDSNLLQAITMAGGLTKEAGTIVEVRHPGFQPGTSSRSRSPAVADGSGNGVISAAGESVAATPVAAKTLKVDLASIGKEGVGIPLLTDGMVISVEKRDPLPITVDGLVNAPGRFEVPVGENLDVLGAIALSHGISSPVADKIYVIRKHAGTGEPGVIQISHSKAIRGNENILLQPGDIVSVQQTPATILLNVVEVAKFTFTGKAF